MLAVGYFISSLEGSWDLLGSFTGLKEINVHSYLCTMYPQDVNVCSAVLISCF